MGKGSGIPLDMPIVSSTNTICFVPAGSATASTCQPGIRLRRSNGLSDDSELISPNLYVAPSFAGLGGLAIVLGTEELLVFLVSGAFSGLAIGLISFVLNAGISKLNARAVRTLEQP
jgi:hypothetical protein